MNAEQNRVEDVIKDLAAVLKKHKCLLASSDNSLTLQLGEVVDPGSMQARRIASFSYITSRSAEYLLRGERICIRWSDNDVGTRELPVENKRSVIEHI